MFALAVRHLRKCGPVHLHGGGGLHHGDKSLRAQLLMRLAIGWGSGTQGVISGETC